MAALGVFIAGRYTGTLAGTSLGILEDGWRIRWQWLKEMINRTDAYADSDIDAVLRGINMHVGGVFKEILDKTIEAVAPYTSLVASGVSAFSHPTVGQLDTSHVEQLILTALAGTPAAATPFTCTFLSVIQAQDPVDQVYGPTHRKIPFNFQVYPTSSTGIKYFTTL